MADLTPGPVAEPILDTPAPNPLAQLLDRRRRSHAHPARALQTARSQLRFLQHYAECGSIRGACAATKIHSYRIYEWQATDDIFAGLMRHALEEYKDRLLQALHERGVEGVIKSDRVYSDALLVHALRAHMPEKFAPRPERLTTNNVQVNNTSHQVVVPLDKVSDADLAVLARLHGLSSAPTVKALPAQAAMEALESSTSEPTSTPKSPAK